MVGPFFGLELCSTDVARNYIEKADAVATRHDFRAMGGRLQLPHRSSTRGCFSLNWLLDLQIDQVDGQNRFVPGFGIVPR